VEVRVVLPAEALEPRSGGPLTDDDLTGHTLSEPERAALKAGVPFEAVVQTARTPYEGIVDAAQKRNCDLVLMASNGRRGLARFTLGSVTDKVIQLSKVPVLVYR